MKSIFLIIILAILSGCTNKISDAKDNVHEYFYEDNSDTNYISATCGFSNESSMSTAKHEIALCIKELIRERGPIVFYAKDNEVHWRYQQDDSSNFLIPQTNDLFYPEKGIMPAINKEKINDISEGPLVDDDVLIITDNHTWKIHNSNSFPSKWFVERTQ